MYGNDVQTEVLIRFNNKPTHKDYDLAFYKNNFIIGESNQGKITGDYSIKFMVICLNDSVADFKVRFMGIRSNRSNKSLKRFDKIQYHDFLNFEFDMSKKRKKEIENMRLKNLPKVVENRKMAYICNPNYKKLQSKKRIREYAKKKEIVLEKKAEMFEIRRIEKEKRMDKFLKIRIRVFFFLF